MNRIEQVATPAPAQQSEQLPESQQTQIRLPRALAAADVRRRAAHRFQQRDPASARARRGTSGLAVAIAALAVPLLPGAAFGATSAAVAGDGTAKPQAPHARHHLPHGQVLPGPGAVTVQGWTASGWSFTIPARPAEPGLWDRVLSGHHDDYYVPWRTETTETTESMSRPRPVVLPDGTRGEISAYHVTRASPRTDDPEFPGMPQDPADPADSTGPDGSFSSGPAGGAPAEWRSGDRAAVRGARSRTVSGPLIPSAQPANTKQMVVAPTQIDTPLAADTPQAADSVQGTASRLAAPATVTATAALPVSSTCLRSAYRIDDDPQMAAHLRPTADAMDVVVTPRHAPCTARVGYLSQARA